MIDYGTGGGLARVTLDRGEKRNALNPELIALLRAALERAASDKDVRVILLRGAGPDFCAGLDLAGLAANPAAGVREHLEDARSIAALFRAVRGNPRPVVAAVHGRALGGGCGLATACDLVVAAESARFGYPEINLGFVPAIVASLLRRSVGEKQAFELLVSGTPVTAGEALRLGMVNRVWPDAEFAARAEAYAGNLAGKSASALSLTKRLFYHLDGMSLEQAIESGEWVNALARGTPDAQRGIASFADKNK